MYAECSYRKTVNGASSTPPLEAAAAAASTVEFNVAKDAVYIHPTNNGLTQRTPTTHATSALSPLQAASRDDISTGGNTGNIYDTIDEISSASRNHYMPMSPSSSKPTSPSARESAAAAGAAKAVDIDSVYIHPANAIGSDQIQPDGATSYGNNSLYSLQGPDGVGESEASTYLSIDERDEDLELPNYAQLDTEPKR